MLRLLACTFVLFVLSVSALEYPWNEWELVGEAPAHVKVEFTLALKLENLDVLDDLTERLTTPGSPEFRQWKTIEELNEITKPNQEKVNAVLSWLERNNLEGKNYGDFIKVYGAVEDVEIAFHAKYNAYKNILRKISQVIIYRSSVHPTIPVEFRDIIVFITNVSNFPYPSRPRYAKVDDSVDSYYVIPDTLRAQYSVPSTYKATNSKSSQGVAEFAAFAGISETDLQVSNKIQLFSLKSIKLTCLY